MVLQKPKVCLFVHGGFFSGKKAITPLDTETQVKSWIDEFEELKLVAEVDFVFLSGGYGYDLSEHGWVSLANEIQGKYGEYDGFVIVQGIDTVEYTASALSFMLQSLGKPIIVTAVSLSKHHFSETFQPFGEFGLRANLLNAVYAATSELAEVAIVIGDRIIRAHRDIYDSRGEGDIGSITFGAQLAEGVDRRNTSKLQPEVHANNNIDYIAALPAGVQSVSSDADGVFVRAYENGFLPAKMKKDLSVFAKEKPVIISSAHNFDTRVEGALYVDDAIYEKAAFVKFAWLLGDVHERDALYELMAKEVSHEYRG